jgi:hypothetical protein
MDRFALHEMWEVLRRPAMKLAPLVVGMFLGASLVACGAGNNGGWMTKGGWDPGSRAPAAKAVATTPDPADAIPLSALDLENPYLVELKKPAVDPKSPYENEATDSAKAKSDKSENKSEKKPLKGDEPGF